MKDSLCQRKLYVGCALTSAPDEFKESVESIKNRLEANWDVMKFLGLTAGRAADVYDKDIEQNVRHCDAFLAIADYPANGLGWELGVADERQVPTLIVSHIGAITSRLLHGAAEARAHIHYARYENIDEIPALVDDYLQPYFTSTDAYIPTRLGRTN